MLDYYIPTNAEMQVIAKSLRQDDSTFEILITIIILRMPNICLTILISKNRHFHDTMHGIRSEMNIAKFL